jgi:hypothetical protein
LYKSWEYNQEIELEKLRNQAILIGSFFNPEMAKKMIKNENPDYSSSDFDTTTNLIHEELLEKSQPNTKKRKKRKVLLNNG